MSIELHMIDNVGWILDMGCSLIVHVKLQGIFIIGNQGFCIAITTFDAGDLEAVVVHPFALGQDCPYDSYEDDNPEKNDRKLRCSSLDGLLRKLFHHLLGSGYLD